MAHAPNSGNSTSNYNNKAGSNKDYLESIGRLLPIFDEEGNEIEKQFQIEKTKYDFQLELKFSKEQYPSIVKFPYFKANSSDATWNNFNQYSKNGVNPAFIDNMYLDEKIEQQIIKNYIDQHLMYGQQLMSVYVENSRNYCLTQMKKALLMSFKFELIGNIEKGLWEGLGEKPKTKEGNKGGIIYFIEVEGKEKYLTSFEEDNVIYIYQKVSTDEMNLEEHLEFLQETTNQIVHTFWNSLIAGVLHYNEKTVGYNFKAYQNTTNKEGVEKCYLKPVTTLRSLIISLTSVKEDDKWVNAVTRETSSNYENFKGFWYGGIFGLTSQELSFKENDEWVSRLQFPFQGNLIRTDIEGTDTLVLEKYRNEYRNPFLYMEKPNQEVSESEEEEEEM